MSEKKNKGVKRPTGGRHRERSYLERIELGQRQDWKDAKDTGMIIEQIVWLVSLKRIGVLGKKTLPNLHETITEVRKELYSTCLEDAEEDGSITYTKGIMNRAQAEADKQKLLGKNGGCV